MLAPYTHLLLRRAGAADSSVRSDMSVATLPPWALQAPSERHVGPADSRGAPMELGPVAGCVRYYRHVAPHGAGSTCSGLVSCPGASVAHAGLPLTLA